MQDAKLKIKLKSSAHKNKSLSATPPGNGVKKIVDNPQEQGIIVAPLNMEVRYRSTGARRKSYYSLQLECHNSSFLCTRQIKVTREVDLMQ